MTPRAFASCLSLFIAGLSAGCASLSPRSNVSVSVADVRPAQASLLETGAVLTLRFTNESAQPIALKGSSHRLYLNGTSVGRGVNNEAVTVPALSTVTQPVTVYLENLTLLRKATEFSKSPSSIDYRLESQFFSNDATGNARMRTTATGQLDVRGLIDATGGMMPVR